MIDQDRRPISLLERNGISYVHIELSHVHIEKERKVRQKSILKPQNIITTFLGVFRN